MQDAIFTLQINVSSFKNYVDINSILMSAVLKRYSLKTTLHISTQHVNSLAAVTVIQRKHDIMKDERYSVTTYDVIIVYFKTLMKHLNVKKKVSVAKAALFDSYFNEWCENIENMLFIQKPFIS